MRRMPAILALVVLIALPLLMAANGTEKPASDDLFKDMHVVVYASGGDMDYPTTIKDPQFVSVKGRLFVTGVAPDLGHEDDWTAGAKVAVAWDEVAEFVLLSDEQVKRRLKVDDASL